MVVAFPLGKLLYLGVRQLSKPIARQLRRTAVASPFFRRYICAPPAQILHRLEAFVKMRLMGVQGPTEIQPLKEEKAVELGAEILGEAFLYGIAASVILYEYYRSVKKEEKRGEDQDSNIQKLQEELTRLGSEMKQVEQRLQTIEQGSRQKKKS